MEILEKLTLYKKKPCTKIKLKKNQENLKPNKNMTYHHLLFLLLLGLNFQVDIYKVFPWRVTSIEVTFMYIVLDNLHYFL